jgi:hypothetical protein
MLNGNGYGIAMIQGIFYARFLDQEGKRSNVREFIEIIK